MKHACFAAAFSASLCFPIAAAANCFVPARGADEGDRFSTAVFQSAAGTVLAVDLAPFYTLGTPPQPAGGFAEIQRVGNGCFGDELALRMNNASIRVTILDPGPDNRTISFNVCDFGGHENGGARRVDPHDFRDDLSNFDGFRMEDDDGNPVIGETRGTRREMKVAYRARVPLRTAVMGGQELFINSICVD